MNIEEINEMEFEDETLKQEIIEGMKKDGYTEGNTLEDTSDIEETLLKTTWKEEAEQIPIGALKPEEIPVIQKCIREEPITTEEQEQLQEILGQYREAIQTIKPKETLENLENNIQLVEDEKTFLELLDQYDTIQTITMYYPLDDKHETKIVLDVFPITDSQAVLSIQENLSIFKDLTDHEKEVYNLNQSGSTLTREEQAVLSQVERKIEEATQEHQLEIIQEYLAMQTKFHNKDNTYEEMLTVYKKMKPAYLALLFTKVQDMQDLGTTNIERVFRESD